MTRSLGCSLKGQTSHSLTKPALRSKIRMHSIAKPMANSSSRALRNGRISESTSTRSTSRARLRARLIPWTHGLSTTRSSGGLCVGGGSNSETRAKGLSRNCRKDSQGWMPYQPHRSSHARASPVASSYESARPAPAAAANAVTPSASSAFATSGARNASSAGSR